MLRPSRLHGGSVQGPVRVVVPRPRPGLRYPEHIRHSGGRTHRRRRRCGGGGRAVEGRFQLICVKVARGVLDGQQGDVLRARQGVLAATSHLDTGRGHGEGLEPGR